MAKSTLNWNWDRAIFVDREITDDLIASLSPKILHLKEINNQPITIGIDSIGGSVLAMEQILALLKSPNSKGEIPDVIGVGINKVYSSAATLLAMCDYAVALPSCRILFHDIRYGQAYDVTPSIASQAAKDLRRENERIALKLALIIVNRLTWIWIDLEKTFNDAHKLHPEIADTLNGFTKPFAIKDEDPRLDLGGFVAAIYDRTSNVADTVIKTTIEKLTNWKKLENAFSRFGSDNKSSPTNLALFQDANPLISAVNATFSESPAFSWANKKKLETDLTQLLLLFISYCKENDVNRIEDNLIEKLMSEFSFFQEIRSEEHINKVVDILRSSDRSLFGVDVAEQLEKMPKESRAPFLQNLLFQTQVLWAFVLVFSRALFNGEHQISNHDALFLGLVDEISGITDPEPRRLYRNRIENKE